MTSMGKLESMNVLVRPDSRLFLSIGRGNRLIIFPLTLRHWNYSSGNVSFNMLVYLNKYPFTTTHSSPTGESEALEKKETFCRNMFIDFSLFSCRVDIWVDISLYIVWKGSTFLRLIQNMNTLVSFSDTKKSKISFYSCRGVE